MSWTLFRQSLRQNWFLWTLFTLILVFYLTMVVLMYQANGGAEPLLEVLASLPPEFVSALHFNDLSVDYTGFILTVFYGLLAFAISLIYTAILALRLFAGADEDGSMSTLLAMPLSRLKVALTKVVYFFVSIFLMYMVIAIAGFLLSYYLSEEVLAVGPYLLMNLAVFLLVSAVGALTLFASMTFKVTLASLLGVGVPVLFLVLYVAGAISSQVSFLNWFTPYPLVHTGLVLDASLSLWLICAALVLVSAALSSLGVLFFIRRNIGE
ncbi:MAG: ABC transporter permease [Erysipelotrichaceae bacterium]|jgi:ABC-type transport system involved in multi-copper enzyme maturation permease subunit|nr:ABC transporter permease [Erysipelotrichaceae bacterium]